MNEITWVVTTTVAVLGALGALVRWVTPTGRLRAAISVGLDTLARDEVPAAARSALEDHVARQILQLVAVEEAPTAAERKKLQDGYGMAGASALPLGLTLAYLLDRDPDTATTAGSAALGLVLLLWGTLLILSARRSRARRRDHRLRALDPAPPDER